MAKPLSERVTSALSTDRVTITDLAALVDEVAEEIDRLRAVSAKAMADSIELALSERDRDDAADLAARTDRNATALEKALATLRSKLAAKRESESQRAARARADAAIKARDELVERIPVIYEQATSMLIDLAREIIANDAELQASTRGELSAEHIARGMQGNFQMRMSSVTRLTEIRLPQLRDVWDLWPPREPSPFAYMERKPAPKPAPVEKPKRMFPIGAPQIGTEGALS